MHLKLEHIAIFIILVSSISRLLIPQINGLMLFVVFPLLFVWRVRQDASLFRNNGVLVYTILIFWIFVAVVFAENHSQAMNSFTPALGAYLLSIVFYSISRKQLKSAHLLMFSYWLSVFAAIYYLNSIGLVDAATDTMGKDRLGDDKVNSNTFGYNLFYVACSVVIIFWQKAKGKFTKAMVFVGFIVLLYLILHMSLLTASRQILVLVLPFAFFSLLFYWSKGKISKQMIGIAVIVAIALLGSQYVSNMLEDSFLMTRMETDIEDDGRAFLLIRAVEVGCEHPFIGVGPGNFVNYTGGAFSHSSYTELFACTGLLGFVLFASIVILFISQQWRYYKSIGDYRFLYLFIFGLVWAVYNFLYAFYTGVWLMPFLFCVWGYSENLYSKLKQ